LSIRRTILISAIAGALAALIINIFHIPVAFGSQNELVPPTAGIYTGVQFSQKLGDAFKSLAGCNKGSSAPANVGGATVDGQCWIDDSASPWILKRYVNGAWAVEGALDPTEGTYIGVIGGGVASIASGSTVDLGSVPQANVTITGTTTVTGFGSSAPTGIEKTIRFDNALSLTASGSLLVPGGFNLTTANGDRAKVTHLGSGNWEVTQYTRANGVPIDVSAVGKADFTFAGAVPPLHVMGDGSALTRTAYPAYLAKVTIAQNGTRTSGLATITGVANTARMGVGMPVEGTGINSGCTIASIVANTSIALNSGTCVTASGTSTVTVFLTGYGSGGSSSTVGVKDCSGRSFAGRETSATRLTASYFGGNSTAMGAVGGSESKTLTAQQLAAHSHSVFLNDPGHTHNSTFLTFVGGNNIQGGSTANLNLATSATTSSFTGMTVRDTAGGGGNANQTAFTGSGFPFDITPPMLIADCVVRVTP
jgi:hypothetical protein